MPGQNATRDRDRHVIHSPTRQAIASSAVFLGFALYFVLVEVHRPAMPAQDVYAYFLPNAVHAVRSFWDGGRGLLWNPYQSCGQPFLANTEVGLFYPPHLVFLLFDANTAVHVVLIFNMVAGATGMYLLARELGLSVVAAVGGALVYELGDPMGQLISWSPMHSGPWTWVPWALLFCERLLRRANGRDVVGLAIALGLQLVAGFVLVAVLTYQLIGLRVVWELVTRWRARPISGALAVLAGLACGAFLVAIQLLPAAELVGQSSRITGSVWMKPMDLAAIAARTARRGPPFPFMAAPLLLAGLALATPMLRRVTAFYVVVGLLFALLALGAETPLFALYTQLPFLGATVRNHVRLFWITGFCMAMLTALSLEGLHRGRENGHGLAPLLTVLIAALLFVLAPGGLRWTETLAVVGIVTVVLAATIGLVPRRPAVWVVVCLVAFNLAAVPLRWPGALLFSIPLLDFTETVAEIHPSISAADRVLLEPSVGQVLQARFVQKTSTMLRVPGFHDYEPLLTQRFEKYWAQLITTSGPSQRPLVNLASLRILIASPGTRLVKSFGLPQIGITNPQLEVSINSHAFPRARYVPRVEIIPDPNALLERMGANRDDFATVAFVEQPPSSGFTGEPGAAHQGAANFALNDPEHVVIDVDAPQRGFLVLADQYFPGWRARVNGADVPVLRANYLFRLVEVPAGKSRVEFSYLPTSVVLGAVLSALTVAVLGVVFLTQRRL